ncbi:MAG TPA: recombinase family protein [Desulfobacteraceae bacterium]|nr:recombinase family protein [Desulfobacteraceae bacterium]
MAKAYSYIRFSSPEQEKGDSTRRQTALSEQYATQHGLTLDDSLRMTDRGLSAYHGQHKTKGTLGAFLKLVEAGKIEKGSVLLVENMDRLSREQVLDALNQFTSIIKAGITLVTLQDGMTYSEESITRNWTQLIVSIAMMARAHEESATKAKRLSSAWKEKRARIHEQPMTAKTPGWICLSKDRAKFELIPEVAAAVKAIFRMKAGGKSTHMIERELNDNPKLWKPPQDGRNKAGGWRKSYIEKILRNRSVIGEFQPHMLIERKRQPIGEPIKDYFPPVIDSDLFHHVQGIIKANGKLLGRGGGRIGKATNLFTHLAKCGLCGGALHFVDKGKPPKGSQYLVCDIAKRLRACQAKPIRYDEFEQLFFQNFEELDITLLVPNNSELESQLDLLRMAVSANQQRLTELETEIVNLTDSIATTGDKRVRETLEKGLSHRYEELARIESENIDHAQEITALEQQRINLQANIDRAMELYGILDGAAEKDRIALRLRLQREIRSLVDRIDIYPLQEKYIEFEEVEPGIVKHMASKYIDKVRIRFKGSRKLRLLYLKRHAEIQ